MKNIAPRVLRFVLLTMVSSLLASATSYADVIIIDQNSIDVSNQQYERFYRRGLEHLQAGRLREAEAEFKLSIDKFPNYLPPQLGIVSIYFQTGREAQAERKLVRLSESNPEDRYVQESYAQMLAQQGRYQEAIDQYKRVLSLDSESVSALVSLGDLYIKSSTLQATDQAIERYRQAIRIDSQHGGAYYALGIAQLRKGDKEAERSFDQASVLAPNNPLPQIMLGKLYFNSDRQPQAKGAFQNALERDAQSVEALKGLGDVLSAEREHGKAIELYGRATKIRPRDESLFMRLGMEHAILQHWPMAMDAFDKVIQINETNALALNNMAWISLEHLNEPQKAVNWAKKAVESSPRDVRFLDSLGWAYYHNEQVARAVEVFRQALKINESSELHYHLGVALLAAGEEDVAHGHFKKAISLDSDSPSAKAAKAKLEAS